VLELVESRSLVAGRAAFGAARYEFAGYRVRADVFRHGLALLDFGSLPGQGEHLARYLQRANEGDPEPDVVRSHGTAFKVDGWRITLHQR